MAFGLDNLVGVVQKGFASFAAVATPASLRNDDLVREIARTMFELLPFPIRLAVRISVGADGFERFVLGLRDRMLDSGVTDLSKLSTDQLRGLVFQGLAAVPGLGKLIDAGWKAPGEPATRSLAAPKIWYLLRGETRLGPWSDPEFLSFAEQGALQRGDRVWREGFADWVAVKDLPAVAGAVRLTPSAPRPPLLRSRPSA